MGRLFAGVLLRSIILYIYIVRKHANLCSQVCVCVCVVSLRDVLMRTDSTADDTFFMFRDDTRTRPWNDRKTHKNVRPEKLWMYFFS